MAFFAAMEAFLGEHLSQDAEGEEMLVLAAVFPDVGSAAVGEDT